VRWPDDRLIQELLAQVGVPLVSTSVNRHGEPPLGDPEAIEMLFGGAIDLLADAGPRENVLPSTIVDLTRRPPVVVREGQGDVDIGELDRRLRLSDGEGGLP
jgi:L-threonylcarbamoyladenylate synthase